MARILREIMVVVIAAALSVVVLIPAVEVAFSGRRPGPLENSYLVFGMVYGFAAPVSFFLAETWWQRLCAVCGSIAAAAACGHASYLFETRNPELALFVLALLVAVLFAGFAAAARARRRRRFRIAALEADAAAIVSDLAADYGRAGGIGRGLDQAAALAEKLALAAIWGAAADAHDVGDARRLIDAAFVRLEADLAANRVVDATGMAARMVGRMRVRLRDARDLSDDRFAIPGIDFAMQAAE